MRKPRQSRIPTCHPERKHIAKGLCHSCYRRGSPRASCHPDRPHIARGLCAGCYAKALSPWATCHPDRKARTKEKLCGSCYNRKKFLENPEKYERALARRRADYANQGKEWLNRAKVSSAAWSRRATFGLVQEEYEKMLAAQGGLCAICREQPTTIKGERGTFNIDHDHVTDEIRGILCRWCNLLLGHCRDNIERLRAAIAYLENGGDTNRNRYRPTILSPEERRIRKDKPFRVKRRHQANDNATEARKEDPAA
jgi:hypothetical protein